MQSPMPKKQKGYIDAFVLVIPKKNIRKYKKIAREAAQLWMKHGALAYRECIGEDLNPPSTEECPYLPFPQLTKLKPGETVWFSYIEYESKAHRNKVNKAVMKEYEKKYAKEEMKEMPFDSTRMAWGGFTVAIEGE